ncbi:hypothetical protein EN828_05440 [Mesorhizobium sp. M2D.F.Ca.ET.185.01.1.1]|uniref:hypothetical protein n=1 Tax=unclassified Mesorhizobium TaxID=325217 RepID=UPI000FCCB500|nr:MULTISPECIES: hypothetical protein [unclassified Mesorhizobium]TGP77418.1 hypothetical protein EN870_19475 [bacterium M00.F.Ca.ET.227.01.1.1]TGP93213.1 hypothetical protein EN865_19670 [bacterium M00.F.Ca.ET.222.01.1.1]TGP96759.1 hypothetical protein EN864_09955 [bacterium M00.F.Ca.ET.221.01.1.1]TGT96092.1 hypothetical protein EN806_53000 [bacterium M00.F.Ca.ET.163.01.1.1]TGU21176.1 hypothetical protein EN799_54630 [bacterium M00.F.Ca.ET.156.01.1.1]TGU49971.1 hypothetical protein EN789_053
MPDSTVSNTSQNIPDPQPKPATPSPATEKVSGAGPAIAEHSEDAKAPKGGRQPGAYVKDKR